MEPEAVSRRALLRLGFGAGERTAIDYDAATARVRAGWEAAAAEPLLRALEPVAEAARCGDAVRWTRADVQALPYADGAFDVVISTFGAALAPRPRRTARELVRVLRPGGRVVLAAWTPDSAPGRVEALAAPAAGVPPPSAWADEATAQRRFDGLLEWLEHRIRTVTLAFPGPDALLEALAGPAELDGEVRTVLAAGEPDARYALYAGRRLS